MIIRKKFHVGNNQFYHSCLKLFSWNVALLFDGPFIVSNFFPYGAIESKSLEVNKVLRVNGHCLKTFYKSWMTKLVVYVELVEPIYEE